MHEMAILKTLILKKFLGGRGARSNTYDQHFGFSNLGSMWLIDWARSLELLSSKIFFGGGGGGFPKVVNKSSLINYPHYDYDYRVIAQ